MLASRVRVRMRMLDNAWVEGKGLKVKRSLKTWYKENNKDVEKGNKGEEKVEKRQRSGESPGQRKKRSEGDQKEELIMVARDAA